MHKHAYAYACIRRFGVYGSVSLRARNHDCVRGYVPVPVPLRVRIYVRLREHVYALMLTVVGLCLHASCALHGYACGRPRHLSGYADMQLQCGYADMRICGYADMGICVHTMLYAWACGCANAGASANVFVCMWARAPGHARVRVQLHI